MTANTPAYGWPYPVGTDRVADGDNAIQDLAEAIEATLDGTPTTGLLTYPSGWDAGSDLGRVWRYPFPLVVMRYTAKNTTGSTAAAGDVNAIVPAGFRPSLNIFFGVFDPVADKAGDATLHADGTITVARTTAAGNQWQGSACWVIP